VQLLDAVVIYGFSDWGIISGHVGTKSASQCEKYYFSEFLSSEESTGFNLPFCELESF
jgi:hypothetical protein